MSASADVNSPDELKVVVNVFETNKKRSDDNDA